MSSKIKVDTIENVAGSGNVSLGSGHNLVVPGNSTIGGTLGVTGETTLATHLNMGDNDRIKLGASSDLQIYHDGGSGVSYINELGSGNFVIQGTNLFLNAINGHTYLNATQGGAVNIFHNNSQKIATTSSGVNVTGNVVSNDGSNNARFQYDNNNQILIENDSAMNFYVNGNNNLKIDSAGHITQPLQSAFSVNLGAGSQSNIAVGSDIIVQFDNEIFDQNADFNTTNHKFTAPVTGKYQFNISYYLETIDTATGYYYIYFDTSNRNYFNIFSPQFTADTSYLTLTLSILADMDANDEAYCKIRQSHGSVQTDINANSYFSGYLVA